MNSIFLKDMAYRKARVILTTIGITVLIALILMLGGIMNGMRIQAQQYPRFTGANIWISAEGSGSAFIGFSLLVPEHLAYLDGAQPLKPRIGITPCFCTGATRDSWKTWQGNCCGI